MEEKIKLLAEAIVERMEWDGYVSFYIGKTNDIDRRKEEHHSEGLNETFTLAIGLPKLISQYESRLINELEVRKLHMLNKNDESKGNGNASILYVSFKHVIKNEFEIFDDTIPLKEGLPLTLRNT